MGETKTDKGVIETYQIDPGNHRITFKLNGKTYGLFEKNKDGTDNPVADEAKAIFMQNADKPIKIEYYDNESGGKTYHNVTKVEITDEVLQENPEIPVEKVETDKGLEIRRLALLKIAAMSIGGGPETYPTPQKLIEYAKNLEEELEKW